MSIQIYKPNKANNGFAFNFSIGIDKKNNEPVLYISAIAQYSWDDNKRLGSFMENKENPDKNINLKFNEFECGSIIDCLNRRYEYSTFHQFEKNKTTIKFSPWDKPVKSKKFNSAKKSYEEYEFISPCFGLSITKNGNNTFKIPLEPGEVTCLKEYIRSVIKSIYSQRNRNRLKDYYSSQSGNENCPI
jgi:hypothetical protein